MKIGELAREAGVSTKAVRYYESVGLLHAQRLQNGYRDYGIQDVRMVREIRELAAVGIRVEQAKPFLDCLVAGNKKGDDCPDAVTAYRKAITELDGRIADLAGRRAALTELLNDASLRAEPACDLTIGNPMSTLKSITDATFADEVFGSERTVIVDFWAEWCPPCRAIEPILEQLAAEHPDDLTILKINADDNVDSVIEYQALSLPTMKIFRGGQVVGTLVGARPKAALEAALAPYLV